MVVVTAHLSSCTMWRDHSWATTLLCGVHLEPNKVIKYSTARVIIEVIFINFQILCHAVLIVMIVFIIISTVVYADYTASGK